MRVSPASTLTWLACRAHRGFDPHRDQNFCFFTARSFMVHLRWFKNCNVEYIKGYKFITLKNKNRKFISNYAFLGVCIFTSTLGRLIGILEWSLHILSLFIFIFCFVFSRSFFTSLTIDRSMLFGQILVFIEAWMPFFLFYLGEPPPQTMNAGDIVEADYILSQGRTRHPQKWAEQFRS